MIRWEADKKLWRHGLPRCQHPTVIAVMVTNEAGRRGVREQCTICGKLDTAPLKLAEHPDAPPPDQTAADSWEQQRREAGEAAQAQAQKRYAMRQAAKVEDSADWWARYDEHLHGDEWQRERNAVMARDGGRCQAFLPGCTGTATEVHHLSYDLHNAIGAAPLWDLVAICAGCHHKVTLAERAARKKIGRAHV